MLYLRSSPWVLLLLSAALDAAARPVTVAVWDFDDNSFASSADSDYLRRGLSEMLLADLAGVPGLKLVERVHLRDALEEQRLGASNLVSEEDRLRLGRIVGASTMVFGSFMVVGSQVRVDVRAVDVETSLVKFTRDATTAVPALPEAIHHIAQALAAGIGMTEGGVVKASGDMPVWRRYEQGIALMDSHRYDQAIEVFKAVLTASPSFAAAERQIKLALERMARQ